MLYKFWQVVPFITKFVEIYERLQPTAMPSHITAFLRILLLAGIFIGFSAPSSSAQINADQVTRIGQNALYFEDYMLSIQYFNQAIQAKPYLAQPYLFRAIAKLNLEDYRGAEADASKALELNPYLTDAWEVRGVARQNMGQDRMAVGDYDEALKLLPRNRQLLFNKALAQSEIKDYDAARETFDRLLSYYPGFDNGYLGRARLNLATTDTVAAIADIDKALSINKNAVNAYILRADIAINRERDYQAALADIDEAIRLQPRSAGLYINRAFLRYNLDSYTGAMADYDYALSLEPLNATALFNRGLLLAEVSANDLALVDFTRVLELDPDDFRALYNRALIYRAKGMTSEAIADITRVAEKFPEFPGALYIRSQLYQDRGELHKAEKDYKKALALAKALRPTDQTEAAESQNTGESTGNNDVPAELVSKRFATLLTVENNADIREEYNNTAIRGKVQDRNLSIEIEPMMMLSFYSSPTELRRNTYYIKEVDELNATRSLRFVLVVTNAVPVLDEDIISRHFQSVDYYNSYIATHTPRAVDFIGRALDLITVRDYQAAEKDIDRAIALMPDYALAYMIRAQARWGQYLLDRNGGGDGGKNLDAVTRAGLRMKALDDIVADLDKMVELSPRTAIAWFNKGNVLLEREDYNGAINAYTRAIELKPDMGEAYYNRGYLHLKSGNRAAGIEDLGKAGELGIIPAYNLIKRIGR